MPPLFWSLQRAPVTAGIERVMCGHIYERTLFVESSERFFRYYVENIFSSNNRSKMVATTHASGRAADKSKVVVSLLDYGAGNVRSVRNAIKASG